MSNLFKSKKTETQKTEIDPAVYASVLSNIELANQLASVPFTPYQGLLTAPFTQDYMRGEQMTRAEWHGECGLFVTSVTCCKAA